MKSIILGLNFNHADSSACLLINGKLIAAAEEERFNRIKHWSGFPEQSINYCIKEGNIKFKDVTDITINTNPISNINYKIFYFLKSYLIGKKKFEIFKRLKSKISLKNTLFNKFGSSNDLKIHYIDHHISHISSAFYPSGYHESLGISIDGFGDFASVLIADCSLKKIKVIKKILFPNSLGVFYEAVTQFCGFKKYGDEYKLMGLSAYGKPNLYEKIKKNIFKDYDNNFKLNLNYFDFHKKNFNYNFEGEPNQQNLFNIEVEKLFNRKQDIFSDKLDDEFAKNLASSAQKIFEEQVFKILEKFKKNNKNLVYAGGCALNSLANGKIISKKLFQNVYIPYCPGDNGGCIGSALYLFNKKFPKKKMTNLQTPYLGKSYNENEITESLKKYSSKLQYSKYENFLDLTKLVALKLKENKIIGWFQDKMEFGPRALGNRSIVSSPIGPDIKNLINSKIKIREGFRPFAPTVLNEKVDEWFNFNAKSNYMSFVLPVKKEKKEIIPAVTHVDGTGRLQTISKENNEKFHQLILEFEKITNVPILLNTSFNENEPIVMTPDEAIECFNRTEMDYLILNNFFISKI